MSIRNRKKTIREWEQAFGIVLVEFVGVTATHNKLLTLPISRKQFQQVASECTVATETVNGLHSEKELDTRPTVSKKLVIILFVFLFVFTMPTLATLIFSWLYYWIARWIRIKWYVPAGFLFAALIILLIQPVTPLIAGPGYVWYQVCNFVVHGVTRGFAIGRYYILHQSLNLINTDVPLFSKISFHGYSLNLYFQLSEAISSSVYWAVVIVCIKDLFKQIKSVNKKKHGQESPHRNIGNPSDAHSILSEETRIWVP